MESPLRPPAEPDFRLIETLAFRPGQGFIRLDRHLARMARTAQKFGIDFDRADARTILNASSAEIALRCRLTLDANGKFELTTGDLAANPPVWRVGMADQKLSSPDIWLRHKTTRRTIYDKARAGLPDGVDELLFLNERDELCEGTITNLFLTMPDGRQLTPALRSGLLPGILREELLDNKQVIESILTLTDLKNAQNIYCGNSLRGLIRAELVAL
ncbi:4-amino-4-deoxychorismate lyase [Ruegeria sp. ANG-R]|uniref:aminotransferase class IV family protein n=1 Tax=Ruegeria sp. ANG-R TaxID=1577903 RepID=UPI0005805019|nr:aminotransferase class IV family protein [Ruegeria sp. ANG-R]KIC41642.1 4-amino-4-deoxychorismate lyase [Ruegeria sp. ANG-R]